MTEWKELEIGNLPPDILTGDYEFEFLSDDDGWELSGYNGKAIHILKFLIEEEGQDYRYRKPEPKVARVSLIAGEKLERGDIAYKGDDDKMFKCLKTVPTHEEIMTKWWKIKDCWYKVNSLHYASSANKRVVYHCGPEHLWSTEFIDKESSDLPPEA